MSTVRARVTTEAEVGTRGILAPPTSPAITGDGSVDIVCGACGTMLIKSRPALLGLRNIVIRCPRCHQCNDAGGLRSDG